MKQFEKDLKKLLSLSEGCCDLVYAPDSGIDEARLRYLSAKDLIALHPAGDNEFFISVKQSGLTYFDNKLDHKKEAWKNRILGFVFGVLTTVSATLLTKYAPLLLAWLLHRG